MQHKLNCFLSVVAAMVMIFGSYFNARAAAITKLHNQLVTVTNAYYVSVNGNDANVGTQAQPWRTIQQAANTGSGTIYVLAGTYPERVKVTRAGLIFEAQGVVTMKGFTIAANDTTVRGFNISDTPFGDQDGWGIWVTANNSIVKNNHITRTVLGGITIHSGSGNQVINNKLERNSQVGVDVRGSNNLVEGNEVWGTVQHPNWTSLPSYISPDADGIRFFGASNTLRSNYIHDIINGTSENIDSHTDCFQSWADVNHPAAQNVVIEKNTCKNLQNAKNISDLGAGFTIEDTVASTSVIIRNNLVYADVGFFAHDAKGISILNNDFFGVLGRASPYPAGYPVGVQLGVNNSDITLYNNILYDFAGPFVSVTVGSALQGGYNIAFRTDGKILSSNNYNRTLDLWGVNPQFVNAPSDYHLKSNSLAINSGMVVQVTNDYDGSPRPQGGGYDVGAFEFGGTFVPTSIPSTSTVISTSTIMPTVTLSPASPITATPTLPPANTPIATLLPTNTPLPTLPPTNTLIPTLPPTLVPSAMSTQLPTRSPVPPMQTPTTNLVSTPVIAQNQTGPVSSVDVRINRGKDDVEEGSTGSMYINSSDLELIYDSNAQVVGLRFRGVNIPRKATILDAYIQFKVDESTSDSTALTIQGEASPNATAFTTTSRNVSSRRRTNATVAWLPLPWLKVGAKGMDQRTPNLAPVIQEIVGQVSWESGNSLVIIIRGSGKRVAKAFEGDAAGAPLLHIDFATNGASSLPILAGTATAVSVSSPMAGTPTSWNVTVMPTETLPPLSPTAPVTVTETAIPTATPEPSTPAP